ncbi:unnamed protein product [Cyprideis torosa]|uniref:Radical S-adenosyl methionine domain-containing protein 1, mitochondrial n=1 Tax=Cyprideis torosa TaxID=163714 RepID=A0A7R8W3R5_9CRUS|nr:unnamed protein product [Cyprideis torosa]CAG0878794.1 unnamed protein product [Cyprideis torosa]
MRNFTELPPLGLYIHIPWCIKKCPYCDFNSHAVKEAGIPESDYVDALLADLTQELPDIWGRSISSVFIGGGTPSTFSARSLDRLLSGVRALTNLHPEGEITIEANPGTFEQEKFNDYRSIGINRLSIGAQSFNPRSLAALGRIHDAAEAENSVAIARKAGFEKLNLDLMFGLPGQTADQAMADLDKALSLEPDHISWYQLTMEPNTAFYRNPPTVPDMDQLWEIHNAGITKLENAGFKQYEVSAFSRERKQCVHNLNYWTFGDYVGIGAGAHGKISFADRGEIIRRQKQRHPNRYLNSARSEKRLSGESIIEDRDTLIEFMMNALRLKEGVERPVFSRHTGIPTQIISRQVDKAVEQGFLEDNPHRYQCTALGYQHLNTVLEIFIPEAVKTVFIPVHNQSESI